MVFASGCAARLFRRLGAAAGIGATLLAVGAVPPCSAARQHPPACCCDTACPGRAMAGRSECCAPAAPSDLRTAVVSRALEQAPAILAGFTAAPLPPPLLSLACGERAVAQFPPAYARNCVLRL